ncbi:MAG TPA: immunoglobulin domain-containing protein, partial [Blastocatellia bacterium]
GATASTYTTPATVAGDNGALYSVVVSGTCGTPITSGNATLTVNNAAAITTQPQSATVCAGATASFSVAATGAGLTYQWRKNSVNISGATAATYTTPATVSGDNGALYSVVVTGICGTPVTSSSATLTVNNAAAITTQPQSATVCVGATASVSVAATGAGLSYQWQKNGVNISGATAATYTTPATINGDNGALYSVIVSGACGTPVTSGNATLTVNPAAGISTQPQSATVCAGATASFSVTATGTGLTYQWRKNGVNIAGATAAAYTTPATLIGDNGALYSVVVSSACGTPVTSGNATLTVNAATAITTQPVSQNKVTGQSATFSVVATGTGTLTYQWRKGGVNIPGATASSYTIASVVPADAGNYDVVVTGTCGSVTSNLAVLNINCVTITVGPPTLPDGVAGTAYNQTISATPTAAYTFALASGALPTGLSLNPTTGAITGTPSAAGTFMFSITATDANNCSDAQSYSVTICAPVAINTPPAAQTVCEGSPATFSVVATGTGLSYQWRKGGTNIPGATLSSLTIASASAGDAAQYDVVVTGACGTATSTAAALTVNAATAITTPPVAQTVCEGSAASFSVVAAGTNLTYQWRKNSVNIPGATLATYNIASPVSADAGSYDVVVSGSCGSNQTSTPVTLTVNTAPAISMPPADQTVCADSPVSFSVTATGTGLTYQWKKNNVNIPGATSATFNLAAATAA